MPNCNCTNLLLGSKPPRPRELPKPPLPESMKVATSKKERYEILKKDVHLVLNRFCDNFTENMTVEVINEWLLSKDSKDKEILIILDKLADLFDEMKAIRDRFEWGTDDYSKYDYKLDGIRHAIHKVEEEW